MKSTVLYEQLQAIDDDILLRSEQHQPTAAALWRRMGVVPPASAFYAQPPF